MSRRPSSSMAFLFLLVCSTSALGQVKRPPVPEAYDVKLHYQIDAFRNGRARQFLSLKQFLDGIGFQRDRKDAEKGEDLQETINSDVNRMIGSLPSAQMLKLINESHTQVVQIKPKGSALPDPELPVRAEIYLRRSLGIRVREQIYPDIEHVLIQLGFRPSLGFLHNGYSRLVGQLPVKSLDVILSDVRLSPKSWSLLPTDLLDRMRKREGGTAFLGTLLEQWSKQKGGDKIVKEIVDEWRKEADAQALIKKLPPEVTKFPEIVDEQLLEQLYQHPEGGSYLEEMLKKVFESPEGTALMKPLLRRLQTKKLESLLPILFRGPSPIIVVEARPDQPLPVPRPETAKVPADQEKLTPSVRKVVKDTTIQRFEILLNQIPDDRDRSWVRDLYRTVPSLVIEGRTGPVVTVRCKGAETPVLTSIQRVSTVRFPRGGSNSTLILPKAEGDPNQILLQTGLNRFHQRGARGQGIRVGVISDNFRGWEALVGSVFPRDTRYMDMTISHLEALTPDKFPAGNGEGSGTTMARAVMLASPRASLTLIRVDPTAPYQMKAAIRYLHGQTFISESLRTREEEIGQDRYALEKRSNALNEERVAMLLQFPDNRPQTEETEKAKQDRKKAYLVAEAKYKVDKKEFNGRVDRFLEYKRELARLQDVQVVVSGLTWISGYPADGSGWLARMLDQTEMSDKVWVQAVGSSQGQVWTDLYRDQNRDGIMELAPIQARLPKESWSPQLGFLAWQPSTGDRTLTLPANAKVRVSVQWQESHDPRYAKEGEDPYRIPLNRFRALVLQQLDADGKLQPSDDLAVVAQTAGLPQRLQNQPGSATYEHVVDFTVSKPSRFAIRIEGDVHPGAQPRGAASLPATEIRAEVKPRVIVEVINGDGRVVFSSYASSNGDIPTPADSQQVLTVGALGTNGKPQPYSATGAPYGLGLVQRPGLFFFDRLGLKGAERSGGSACAAALAGGMAANLLSTDLKPKQVRAAITRISKQIQAAQR